MKFFKSIATAFLIAIATANFSGCTRIQTGEVGVRVDAALQVQGKELEPGSFNQTVIGSVLTFPVKDVTLAVDNKQPLTADNSALDDFDFTIVYNINPSSAAELYSTKNKNFHHTQDGDVLLMYNRISVLANNAAYKAVRKFKSLEVGDNREKIEADIKETVSQMLHEDNLGNVITISSVAVRAATPNKEILSQATQYVKSQNELKVKENEVKIAEAESRRMAALSANSVQSIEYMNAQARLNYSEAAKAGKVGLMIVPVDFKGNLNVNTK